MEGAIIPNKVDHPTNKSFQVPQLPYRLRGQQIRAWSLTKTRWQVCGCMFDSLGYLHAYEWTQIRLIIWVGVQGEGNEGSSRVDDLSIEGRRLAQKPKRGTKGDGWRRQLQMLNQSHPWDRQQ